MTKRKITKIEIKDNKEKQKFRIKVKKAARRSGKITQKEGKVEASKLKRSTKVPGNRSSRS